MFFHMFAKLLTNSIENSFIATCSHFFIREIGMHPSPIPIATDRFWSEINLKIVLLTNPIQEKASNPKMIRSRFCSLAKNLVFPLANENLSIDTFNVDSTI